MTATIKAIETHYNGYRFRSRLEARWAVFFDTLDIKYEYEPEGFELGDGIRYLPDFWLPEQKYWIEIKPEAGAANTRQVNAFAEYVRSIPYEWAPDVYFHILVGTPALPEYGDVVNDATGERFLSSGWHLDEHGDHIFWTECPDCKRVRMAEYGDTMFNRTKCCDRGWQRINAKTGKHARTERLKNAYDAARSARFEFGR